ncbi:MAG: hypothetical protein ABMA64_01560 [Myxococcota bacterium]
MSRFAWAVLLVAGCPKGGGVEAPVAAAPVVFEWSPGRSATEPELLGSLMTQFYDLHLLISATRAGDSLTLVVASSPDGAAQDSCAATTTLPPVSVGADGAFEVTTDAIGFTTGTLPASIRGVTLAGRVSDGGLSLDRVAGLVDTREFLPLLGSAPDDALCSMMPAMGDCVPCADGAPRCWAVAFTGASPTVSTAAVTPHATPCPPVQAP